jgi:hypothetical protein
VEPNAHLGIAVISKFSYPVAVSHSDGSHGGSGRMILATT